MKKKGCLAPVGKYGGGTLDEKWARKPGLKSLKTKEQRESKTIKKADDYKY
jgi:hypothetical protein